MNWKVLFGIFAKPLGGMVNNAISAGAAAVLAYSATKGNPLGDVTGVVSMFALGLSQLISGFAASQGVQIPVINASDNGVQVVKVDTGGQPANAPAK